MEQIQPYLDQVLDYVRAGFDQINGPQGLLIALAATVFLQSWKQWLPVAVVAGAVHIAVDTLAPVLAGQAALRLPPLVDVEFWQGFAVLVAGYAVIIAVFFFIKRLLVPRSASDGKPVKAR
jgi:hypothetical protein